MRERAADRRYPRVEEGQQALKMVWKEILQRQMPELKPRQRTEERAKE